MKEKESNKGKKVPHRVLNPDAQEQLDRVWRAQGQLREVCECGFKIRGPHHKEGTHHKLRHPSLRRKP